MRRKIAVAATVAIAVVSMLLCVACGKEAGQLTDQAAARTQESEDNSEYHYIDENAIALAGSAATGGGAAAAQGTLAILNGQRQAAGLATLAWNAGLEQAAQVRAQECASSFSHTRPDGSDWWTVNSALMYGENLAEFYYSAEDAMNAWMASPGHRANIMDPSFRSVGVAVYESSNGKWYWAQEFGY